MWHKGIYLISSGWIDSDKHTRITPQRRLINMIDAYLFTSRVPRDSVAHPPRAIIVWASRHVDLSYVMSLYVSAFASASVSGDVFWRPAPLYLFAKHCFK